MPLSLPQHHIVPVPHISHRTSAGMERQVLARAVSRVASCSVLSQNPPPVRETSTPVRACPDQVQWLVTCSSQHEWRVAAVGGRCPVPSYRSLRCLRWLPAAQRNYGI